jgi:hypothetical protein
VGVARSWEARVLPLNHSRSISKHAQHSIRANRVASARSQTAVLLLREPHYHLAQNRRAVRERAG